MRILVFIVFFLYTRASFAQEKWTLEDCIQYAYDNNLQIKASKIRKRNQESNLRIAEQEKLPTLSAGIGNTLNFGNQQFAGLIIPNDYYNSSPSLSTNVILFNNGKVDKEVHRLEFEVEASQYDIESTKNAIAIQITQQFLNSILQKEIVKISNAACKNALKLLDKAQKTTDIGITSQTVLAEAKAALAKEHQNVKSAEIERDRAFFNLKQLLQLKDNLVFDIVNPEDPNDIHFFDMSLDSLLSTSYRLHPQILATQQRLKAAQQQTEVLKSNLWPTLSLSAGVGTFYFRSLNGTNTQSFIHQVSSNFSQQVMLNINIPIYNKGITKSKIQQSKVNIALLMNDVAIQKQDIKDAIQKVIFDLNASYEKYRATEALVKSSKISNEFAEKGYNAGKTSIYDVNISHNNFVNAQGSLAQAKFNYLFQLRLLDFYMGKYF